MIALNFIKKITAVMAALCCFSTAAFAAVITPSETVIIPDENNEITFSVTLETDESFAGVEFGIKPSDEKLIFKSVEYSNELQGEASVKTIKDGCLYFGFFAADNKYDAGECKVATVTYTYSGSESCTLELISSKLVRIDEETGKTLSDTESEPFVIEIKPIGAESSEAPISSFEPEETAAPSKRSGGSSGGGSPASERATPTPIPIPEESPEPEGLYNIAAETYDKTFSDIENHWAGTAILQAVKRGYFSGVSDSEFMPDKQVTRAMAAAVMGRFANGEDTDTDISFADVPHDAYYVKYLAWCNGNGIIMGMDDLTFAPDLMITCEQLCAIISRYLNYIGKDVNNNGDIMQYYDYADISDWALSSVALCNRIGLIVGDDNNMLRPKDSITRAEFAAVIMRLAEYAG